MSRMNAHEIYVRFPMPELCGAALSRLKAACRFDPANEAHARMLGDALDAHCGWAEGAELKAVAARFPRTAPRGTSLNLDDVRLVCAAFGRMDARDVLETVVYALALTTNEPTADESATVADESAASQARGVSRLFYEDLWANAYIDAALLAFKADLAARAGGFPSASFGPGYYGMALTEMKKLDKMLNFGNIGAEVLGDGSMRPLKACAGLFFVLRGAADASPNACRDCAGDKANCAFCERPDSARDRRLFTESAHD
ncbi:MAG: hypothetical protein LBP30_07405 [Clostridiales Family XIII bacterium]|nr:hypothetical protein [Clostridiales Family XIII bacterium]